MKLQKFPVDWRPISSEHGIGIALILVIAAVVGLAAATAGGTTAYFLLRERGQDLEQTAKFVPDTTDIYFSLNLRPGADQMRKFRDILERFRQRAKFQANLDDLLNEAERETGIDLVDEVIPWAGPEIGVAVIDVVESFVAAGVGDVPQVVVIFGTSDRQRSEAVLEDWTTYLEEEEGSVFQEDAYRGFRILSEGDNNQHYALTNDHVLLATDLRLLKDTIDRIEDEDTTGSLYESARFQEARNANLDDRFSLLYVDADSIWSDARLLLAQQLPTAARDQLGELIPEWATLAGSFIGNGAKLVLTLPAEEEASDRPAGETLSTAARRLPSDTVALLAFAVNPDLTGLREQLEKQKLGDLGPGLAEDFTSEFGMDLDADASLSDLLDAGLIFFRLAFGVDLEKDVLDWMTGELALALLPTDFQALAADPTSEALQAAAFIRFEASKRENVEAVMADIRRLLQEKLGLESTNVSYGGGIGATFDLTDNVGVVSAYKPGYLILGDQLVIATTEGALELVASIEEGGADSLASDAEFSRLLREVPDARDVLIYANIREIREAVVASLDPDDEREYREEAEPFVEPLSAMFVATEREEGLRRIHFVLTVE